MRPFHRPTKPVWRSLTPQPRACPPTHPAEADFKFNGSIDDKGHLEGSGQMNPMNALQYSKANVSLKDFALPPVSPYSGKFIGFKIDQGTLNIRN
jgi:hypothetical protein